MTTPLHRAMGVHGIPSPTPQELWLPDRGGGAVRGPAAERRGGRRRRAVPATLLARLAHRPRRLGARTGHLTAHA